MSDLISRQAAIDMKFSHGITEDGLLYVPYREVKTNLEEQPSAQPDVPDRNVGDMISRQAAIDAVVKESQVDGAYGYMDTKSIVDLLNDLPSAQRTGRWIYDDEAYPGGNPYGHYECDQCGECVPHRTNFCPNCGSYNGGQDAE